MNSKRSNNQTNTHSNLQQPHIDNKNGPQQQPKALSNNAENDDPNPNVVSIINATELNLSLLPRNSKNVSVSRPTNRKNETVAAIRSIDRNKAREHIAEQQKKRLLEKKAAVPDVQKDEIKKRLAALHQSSIKILKKNVAKKRKGSLAKPTETVDKAQTATQSANQTTWEQKLTTPTKPPSTKPQPVKEVDTEPEIDATPSKRGILRRKELFDGPPAARSPARLDKTFISSLLQSVKQRQSTDRHESSGNSSHAATPPRIDEQMKLRVPQSELKSKLLSGRTSSKSRSKSWDVSRTSHSTNKRSGSSSRSRNDSSHNIPFWLKPTSAQTYPYNFIMAVRKKLESVTQPVLVDPTPLRSNTPLARPKKSRDFHSWNFRQNLDKADATSVEHDSSKAFLSMIDAIPPMQPIIEKPDEKVEEKMDVRSHHGVNTPPQSKAASEEFSTNFSSISLHITDRNNTMSELSSIQSEQPIERNSSLKISQHVDDAALTDDDGDDDTTISSAILSRNSPEKKSKPQPLSTEAIKDLKICSTNSNLSVSLHPFVNTRRGDDDSEQRSMVEMFETFSKNLSQVISVNERLHSALSTSLHHFDKTEQRNDLSEMKHLLQSGNRSLQLLPTNSDPVYTTSFEATIEESIQEADEIHTHTKTETDLPSNESNKSNNDNEETGETKTVSEPKTGSVVVTASNIQTVTSWTQTNQKTQIVSNVQSVDPEFRRYSTASSIIGSDIFAVFSQSDEENSLHAANLTVSCEESFNYSSIGMMDQLINNEKQKSEHLSKLMLIREKRLVDHTKGQIAWLELQKQKYKEKGLTDRISAVKKKQRALLMHMAAERANIVRLNKLQNSPKSQRSSSKFKFQNFSAAEVSVRRSSVGGSELNNVSHRSAFRAFEIDGTQGLEEILRKREQELQKRRNHVEHLMKWHQRLNREEDELRQMEQMLMAYTSGSTTDQAAQSNERTTEQPSVKSPRKVPHEIKKIKNIEKSLQMLHNMSSTSVSTNGEEIEDIVEATGHRLNKLWRRLTGENADKFDVNQHYKLNKFDLEKMYEDAKNVVVIKFTKNKDIGPLNDLSASIVHASTNSLPQEDSVIPSLDLNFSQESPTNSVVETNVDADTTEGNDNYYFSDVQTQKTSNDEDNKSAVPISDDKVESDQDNTQAETISLDNNNSSLSEENSYGENIDEISFPHLKDVTSLEQSLLNHTNSNSFYDDSVNTVEEQEQQQITSPSDAIISDDKVIAPEFDDNNLSDEYQPDNTADKSDKSLQLKTSSSSDDESKSVTKSNQTMFGDSSEPISEQVADDSDDSHAGGSDEVKSIGLEQRLIDLDGSLKDLSEAIDRAPVMEVNCADNSIDAKIAANGEKIEYNEVKMLRNKNINESFPTVTDMINAGKHDELYHSKNASLIRDYVSPASELKMPDIISEAEVLRRQQLNIEQEIKHLDQSVPAVFTREIPNKPPPPYCPPANGSPMNTIHPTDERIKEIVYRRIGELYNSISDPTTATDKSQSILSENITNIYERIILDMCSECIAELDIDASSANCMKFKQRLAFYNPPNRLAYVQEYALKKVKKLLDPNGMVASTQASQIGACVKRKRDLVDEMLVMEMIEDESKWSNFDLEEKEVIENIVEQIVLLVVNDAVDDAAIWRTSKQTSVLKDVVE